MLSIILYSDATLCDNIGKTSKHPVFLTLGNIPAWKRNKPEAKELLCYMPVLRSRSSRNSQEFRNICRDVYQRCWSIMLRPILELKEMEFSIRGSSITFIPKISVFIADMLEANAITCTFKSANCKRPCPTCTLPVEMFSNMELARSEIILRTPMKMQSMIERGKAHEYSIHPSNNFFWEFP